MASHRITLEQTRSCGGSSSAQRVNQHAEHDEGEHERSNHEQQECSNHADRQSAISGFYRSGLLQVTLEQLHVLDVGSPAGVENVPECGHGAHEGLESNVVHHAPQHPPRCAETTRLDDDKGRRGCARDVSEPWNETQDRIEADPEAGKGNPDDAIEETGERSQAFDAWLNSRWRDSMLAQSIPRFFP